MNTDKLPPRWLTFTIVAANCIAILDLPYGYYQLLRLLVSGYAGYIAYQYFNRHPQSWGWIFAFIAVLFNPLFVIHMSKGFHAIVNLGTAGMVLFELYRVRRGMMALDEAALRHHGDRWNEVQSLPTRMSEAGSNDHAAGRKVPLVTKYRGLLITVVLIGGTVMLVMMNWASQERSRSLDWARSEPAQDEFNAVREPASSIDGQPDDGVGQEQIAPPQVQTLGEPTESIDGQLGPSTVFDIGGPVHVDDFQSAVRPFVEAYFAASGDNSATTAFVARHYADSVKFFGSNLDKDEILRQKSAFIQRWPERAFVPSKDMTIECQVTTCTVNGTLVFEARSPARFAHSAGRSTFELELMLSDADIRIVGEDSKVIRRDP